MSNVTNAVLSIRDYNNKEGEILEQVNGFFDDGGFVSVESPTLPRGWYGGSKNLETSLAIGAFNYLNLQGLVSHIKKVCEGRTELVVQLMVLEEERDKFRIIDVVDRGVL